MKKTTIIIIITFILIIGTANAQLATIEGTNYKITVDSKDALAIKTASLKEGVLTVNTTKDIKATVEIMNRNCEKICSNKVLYRTNDKEKWKDIGIRGNYTNGTFKFSVSHFSQYNVTDDYDTIEECFDAINNTIDGCVLGVSNYSEVFSGAKYYNFSTSDYVLKTNNRDNVTVDFSSSSINMSMGGSIIYGNDGQTFRNLIGYGVGDTWQRGVMTINAFDNNWFLLDNIELHNFNLCLDNGGTLVGTYYVNNSWLDCVTTGRNVNTYSTDYIENTILEGGEYHVYEWNDNTITWKNVTFIGVTFVREGYDSANYTIQDNVINNTVLNMAGASTSTLIQRNSFNCAENSSGLTISTNNIQIENNTFNNCGLTTYQDQYLIGNTRYSYGGENFSGMVPVMINAALDHSIGIVAENTDTTEITTGLNNFSLWLANVPAASINMGTLYVEQPNGMSCADVAIAYGGTCYLDEQDFLQANGELQSYTIKSVDGLTIYDGSEPMFLNYNNLTVYDNVTIKITSTAESTNITGNVFLNSYVPIMNNGTSTNVWKNHFYSYTPINYSATDYCIGSEGNYYRDTLTPVEGDCGMWNWTIPIDGIAINDLTNPTQELQLNWTRQSGRLPISYIIYWSLDNVTYTLSDFTSALGLLWNYTSVENENMTQTVYLMMLPNDGNYNAQAFYKTITITKEPYNSISNIGILIIITAGVIYLWAYRKNGFVGSVMVMALGALMIIYTTEKWSYIIIIIGGISAIYSVVVTE